MKEKLNFTNYNYFCSSQLRPDCIRGQKNNKKLKNEPLGNLCCLYCESIEQCQQLNKSKTKPCTCDIVCMDEYCPYAI